MPTLEVYYMCHLQERVVTVTTDDPKKWVAAVIRDSGYWASTQEFIPWHSISRVWVVS